MTSVSGSGYLLFLSLLTAAECDLVVVDTAGNNVTLPCKYDVITNGLTSICWGRGDIPAAKCNNQLIATDGATVRKDSLVSSRYQLLGDVENGDVSMTILNVSEMDSGRYGCRVEIKGWLNDHKNHIELRVQKEESESGEAWDNIVDPVVALVNTSQSDFQLSSPWSFIGNTFRMSFIIFIPALLLTISYRLMRSQQRPWIGRRILSDQEENSL